MTFDASLVIGILGLLIGGYSIYLVLRKKKYPGKLTLIKENSVGLFNELANNFPEIKIQFNDSPIDKNIIYIKGSIINNGETDLNFDLAEESVSFNLGEQLKWIKTKITKTSEKLQCASQISEDLTSLTFKCGILKVNEFFQFEALIETKDEEINSSNIFEMITPNHRLLNTQDIQITSYLNEKQRQKKQTGLRGYLVIIGLILAINFGGAGYKTIFTVSSDFEYMHEENRFQATGLNDCTVEIEGIDSDESEIISVEEFHKNYEPTIPKIGFWDRVLDSIWSLIFMLGIYAILIIWNYVELRKSRQISDIIEKEIN